MTLEELLANINKPGWDWPEGDFSWLSSESGLHKTEPDGGSSAIFFIHGGRIKEQLHIPYGHQEPEAFIAMVRNRIANLDDPRVNWVNDTGGGYAGFWIEGTRNPVAEDMARLQSARTSQLKRDARELVEIEKRRKAFGKE